MQKQFTTRKISLIGVMAALVFASNFLSIPIPISLGEVSRIHLGNVLCLLSGFMLGGPAGGLAAGIGSALYDLTSATYAKDAAFTFAFKFLMAFICGSIATGGGKNALSLYRNTFAAIAGNFTYVVLYVSKGFITNIYFMQMEIIPALITVSQKFVISLTNMVIACVISVPLGLAIKKALLKLNLKTS